MSEKRISRERMGYEFDAGRFYRESEAAEPEYEAEYQQASPPWIELA